MLMYELASTGFEGTHCGANQVVQHTAVLEEAPLDGQLEQAGDALRCPVCWRQAADQDQPAPGGEIAAHVLRPDTRFSSACARDCTSRALRKFRELVRLCAFAPLPRIHSIAILGRLHRCLDDV